MSEKAIMRVKIDGRWVEVPLLVDSNGKPVQRSVVTVAKTGAEFNSISKAVEYAKTICSLDNRVLVLILDAAIYDEEITLLSNPGIDLAGFGAVIRHNSKYPNAPLYTTGRGTFTGLIFENYNQTTGSSPSYAMHFDYNNSPASGETRFIDCRFVAARSYGAGIGLGPDVELQFDSCFFRSTDYAGLYLHNSPFSANGQVTRFNDCQFFGYEGGGEIGGVKFEDAVPVDQGVISYASIYLSGCSVIPMHPMTSYKTTAGADWTQVYHLVSTPNMGYNVQGSDVPQMQPVPYTGATPFIQIVPTNQNGFATLVKPVPHPELAGLEIISCDVNNGSSITPTIIEDKGKPLTVISTGVPNAVLQVVSRIAIQGLGDTGGGGGSGEAMAFYTADGEVFETLDDALFHVRGW